MNEIDTAVYNRGFSWFCNCYDQRLLANVFRQRLSVLYVLPVQVPFYLDPPKYEIAIERCCG